MDIVDLRRAALRFFLGATAWSLGIFALLRLNWTEAHVVLPLTQMQAGLAAGVFGTPASPVEATLACSGADALALCLGALLAYPVAWRSRLSGAAGGVVLILGLNVVRIGSLGWMAQSPAWFDAFHVYVWPAVLMLAIARYVFVWMRRADRPRGAEKRAASGDPSIDRAQPARRFAVLAGAFLLVFLAASPLYLHSASILAMAGLIARTAAAILGAVGVSAHAAANVLVTPRGGFQVTQECIATPLVPIYLAGVCAWQNTWRRLTLAVLATVPLFVALGIARLLVVALPKVLVASPVFAVHAFYQLLLAAVVVYLAAWWRHGGTAAFQRALAGILAGVLFVYLLGPFYTRAMGSASGPSLDDPQGALAFLPAFQVGLYLALWVAACVAAGWRRFVAGLAVLEVTQLAGLFGLSVLASHWGLMASVRDVRGWSVAGPLLIVLAVAHVEINHAPPQR